MARQEEWPSTPFEAVLVPSELALCPRGARQVFAGVLVEQVGTPSMACAIE